MKISTDVLQDLAKAVVRKGERDDRDGPSDSKYITFNFEEISAVFTLTEGKTKLFGVAFEVLGKDFIIDNDGSILIRGAGDDDEIEETYKITDSRLVASLEKFLQWRSLVMREFDL